ETGGTTTSGATPTRVPHPTKDVLLIRGLFEDLNGQFDTTGGVKALATADYYANYGDFTPDKCLAYWATFGLARFLQKFVPLEPTIRAAPNWLDDGGVHPAGRVYALTVRETVSSPDGKFSETRTKVIHVTLVPEEG